MADVPARELRNHTRAGLQRVTDGERIAPTRPAFFSRVELAELLLSSQADPGLRDDLTVLAGDTTEDLGPVR